MSSIDQWVSDIENSKIIYKLKRKDPKKRNLELIDLLKRIYVAFTQKIDNSMYLSCENETHNLKSTKWYLGDNDNLRYEILQQGNTVNISLIDPPLKRKKLTMATAVYINPAFQESIIISGSEIKLQKSQMEIYAILKASLCARHLSRNSGFYTSNIT
ncbi:hypothetical protein GF323_04610 [Candidatus Woesearchaeota archaeon]|nr:hypothetical protein [Candidatus Woesearchaeota archaeon]